MAETKLETYMRSIITLAQQKVSTITDGLFLLQ